jgi:hypothetical protein
MKKEYLAALLFILVILVTMNMSGYATACTVAACASYNTGAPVPPPKKGDCVIQ